MEKQEIPKELEYEINNLMIKERVGIMNSRIGGFRLSTELFNKINGIMESIKATGLKVDRTDFIRDALIDRVERVLYEGLEVNIKIPPKIESKKGFNIMAYLFHSPLKRIMGLVLSVPSPFFYNQRV